MISKLILTITSMAFLLIAPVSVAVQESVAAIEEPAGDIDDATPQSRRLQAGGAETCGWSPWWRFENDPLYVRKNPKVPCLRHSDCASYTARMLQAPFQPCCLARDCICGSTQSEFIPGVNRCAKFACTSDADCGPGRCVSGRCNFGNIQPACSNDAACGGGNNLCLNGVCHIRDPVTGFITLARGGMGGGMGSTGTTVGGAATGGMGGGMGMMRR